MAIGKLTAVEDPDMMSIRQYSDRSLTDIKI